jgi:hypothetical protein
VICVGLQDKATKTAVNHLQPPVCLPAAVTVTKALRAEMASASRTGPFIASCPDYLQCIPAPSGSRMSIDCAGKQKMQKHRCTTHMGLDSFNAAT